MKAFDYDDMKIPGYADLHVDGPFIYKADESIYLGQFKDNKRHGRGKCAFKQGSIYEGEWSNDKPNGLGRYVCANGDWYLGHVNQGVGTGDGRLTHFDGSY